MTAAPNLARRGACPSLDQPMVTGDGLLVRLTLATRALSPAQWTALTTAAATHGNGRMEISRRGNLQLRGLTADRMAGLSEEASMLCEKAKTDRCRRSLTAFSNFAF